MHHKLRSIPAPSEVFGLLWDDHAGRWGVVAVPNPRQAQPLAARRNVGFLSAEHFHDLLRLCLLVWGHSGRFTGHGRDGVLPPHFTTALGGVSA